MVMVFLMVIIIMLVVMIIYERKSSLADLSSYLVHLGMVMMIDDYDDGKMDE